MKKSLIYVLGIVLSFHIAFAQSGIEGAIGTILDILKTVFGGLLSPSLDGLAILFKFLIMVVTFAVAYTFLPGEWTKGARGVVSGAIGLGAGLAIPTKLALTTAAFYGSFIVAVLLVLPFLGLGWGSLRIVRDHESEKRWIYPGLALCWITYFILLVYFLAHIGTLPETFEWVFLVGAILATLSPIIAIILLAILLMTGEQIENPGIGEMMKALTKSTIKTKAKNVGSHFIAAHALLKSAKKTSKKEIKHDKLRKALAELREAKEDVRVIARQATKILADVDIPAPDKGKVVSAQAMVGELNTVLTELTPLVSASVAEIDAYLATNPHAILDESATQAHLVAKHTPEGALPKRKP